jgi:hypothetical protein
MFWSMFTHVIQVQNFDVLAQLYGIYTKLFRGGCLVDGRRDTISYVYEKNPWEFKTFSAVTSL